MKKINWKDIFVRLAKTFVQAFIPYLLALGDIKNITIGDWQTFYGTATAALLAGASAGICAVWNLIIEIVKEYQAQKNMTEFEKNTEAGVVDGLTHATPEEIEESGYIYEDEEEPDEVIPDTPIETAEPTVEPVTERSFWEHIKYFTKSEFYCSCGAKKDMNQALIEGLDAIRATYGKTIITSGYRCKTCNAKTKGAIKNSLHCEGRAADFYIKGVTDTLEGRKKVIAYAFAAIPTLRYAYCDGYYRYRDGRTGTTSHSNMGKAIHADVFAD